MYDSVVDISLATENEGDQVLNVDVGHNNEVLSAPLSGYHLDHHTPFQPYNMAPPAAYEDYVSAVEDLSDPMVNFTAPETNTNLSGSSPPVSDPEVFFSHLNVIFPPASGPVRPQPFYDGSYDTSEPGGTAFVYPTSPSGAPVRHHDQGFFNPSTTVDGVSATNQSPGNPSDSYIGHRPFLPHPINTNVSLEKDSDTPPTTSTPPTTLSLYYTPNSSYEMADGYATRTKFLYTPLSFPSPQSADLGPLYSMDPPARNIRSRPVEGELSSALGSPLPESSAFPLSANYQPVSCPPELTRHLPSAVDEELATPDSPPEYEPPAHDPPIVRADVTSPATAKASADRRKRSAKFQCYICHKFLTANHNLKRHIDAHRGIKRYPCSSPCSSAFTTAGDLRRHQRSQHLSPESAERG